MITSNDIQTRLNADANEDLFQASDYASAMTQVIASSEAQLNARMPSGEYGGLDTMISGLYLSREATAGAFTYIIPLIGRTPSAVRVWVNYGGIWRDRRKKSLTDEQNPLWDIALGQIGSDANSAEVACTLSGNTITLTDPVKDGDIIIADITHNYANPPAILKAYAIEIAVYEFSKRVPELFDERQRREYREMFMALREDLRDLQRGRIRIKEWDDLDMIDEMETARPPGTNQRDPISW